MDKDNNDKWIKRCINDLIDKESPYYLYRVNSLLNYLKITTLKAEEFYWTMRKHDRMWCG